MVDQFRKWPMFPQPQQRGGNYPSRFPGRMAEAQSAIPSQEHEMPLPYDPSKGQADIAVAQRWSPPVPIDSIVRASFDSRPPMSYDVFWTDRYDNGLASHAFFSVPLNTVLIIRNISIQIFPNSSLAGAGRMNAWGEDPLQQGVVDSSPNVPKLQILVNNVPTPFWTQFGYTGLSGVPIYQVVQTDIEVPCFILVGGPDQVRATVPNFVDDVGASGFDTFVYYYGNLLMSTGRPLVAEVGNAQAQPVQIVTPPTGE